MSWDDKDPKYEKVKEPTYGHSAVKNNIRYTQYYNVQGQVYNRNANSKYYCVIRVGKSFKQLGQVTGFTAHMERLRDTPNADPNIENEILIGDKDLTDTVREYMAECRYVKPDTTIAREMLLTASPDFFKELTPEGFNRWVNDNIDYLQARYGGNIVYACLHMDEKTPHIHALMVPKVWSEARGCYKLSSYQYFGGKDKLRALQTDYAEYIGRNFPTLSRGIGGSKAKHIEIKHFYGILNNVKSNENVQEIFKNDTLLKAKIKALEATLTAYREMYKDKDLTASELLKTNLKLTNEVKDLKKDNELYKRVVKQLSQTYKLPENAIKKVMDYCKNINNERTK